MLLNMETTQGMKRQQPAFTQCVPDPGCCPQSPQGTAFQHRQQHGVDDNEARCPVVNGQPVPSKLCYQLVRKQKVLHQKLCPLSPAGLQLTQVHHGKQKILCETMFFDRKILAVLIMTGFNSIIFVFPKYHLCIEEAALHRLVDVRDGWTAGVQEGQEGFRVVK